jgi:hypothetical protein
MGLPRDDDAYETSSTYLYQMTLGRFRLPEGWEGRLNQGKTYIIDKPCQQPVSGSGFMKNSQPAP